jgi:hypothetical protein
MMFVILKWRGLFEVRTKFLNIIYTRFGLKWLQSASCSFRGDKWKQTHEYEKKLFHYIYFGQKLLTWI